MSNQQFLYLFETQENCFLIDSTNFVGYSFQYHASFKKRKKPGPDFHSAKGLTALLKKEIMYFFHFFVFIARDIGEWKGFEEKCRAQVH
jgi:hypothetical protein